MVRPPEIGFGASVRIRVDDIFDEIEGDLRADRNRQLARRYGGAVVAGVVVLAAGVGAWQGWTWYQARQDRAVAAIYLTAMQDAAGQNPARPQAIAGFARVAAEGPAGYRTLARLREAALEADSGDRTAALALWQQVADDGAAERLLRDLASLMVVEHQLDGGDPAQLRARLAPLAVPTNSWHGLAQEAQALLDLREGHNDAARDILKRLAQDTTAPSGVRGRANGLLARLGA